MDPEANIAFQKLKETMVTAPVLALSDFTKKFMVEIDVSGKGIGALLMQEGKFIAYKSLSLRNQVISIYEREFLAVLMVIKKWKHCLRGQRFTIKTDQQSLKHLLD